MGLSLDAAIDLYLDHLKVERGLARNSVEAYGRDLAKFRRFCAARGRSTTPSAVEPRHLLGYLVALARGKLAARSQARNLVALRAAVPPPARRAPRRARSDRRPRAAARSAARCPTC